MVKAADVMGYTLVTINIIVLSGGSFTILPLVPKLLTRNNTKTSFRHTTVKCPELFYFSWLHSK